MTPEQVLALTLKTLAEQVADRKACRPKPKGAVNPWHRGEPKEPKP